MSGLEFLFLDGGATVTALAVGAASALGFRTNRRHREGIEVSGPELESLRSQLEKAHDAVTEGHKTLTQRWGRGPLSLFDGRSKFEAATRGVPPWAVRCIEEAGCLVDEAAQVCDHADMYEAQATAALEEKCGVERAPFVELIDRMKNLAARLEDIVPRITFAREAFDKPAQASAETPHAANIPPAAHAASIEDAFSLSGVPPAKLSVACDDPSATAPTTDSGDPAAAGTSSTVLVLPATTADYTVDTDAKSPTADLPTRVIRPNDGLDRAYQKMKNTVKSAVGKVNEFVAEDEQEEEAAWDSSFMIMQA